MSKRRRNKREKIVLSIPSDLAALKEGKHQFFGFSDTGATVEQVINNIYYIVKFAESAPGPFAAGETLRGNPNKYFAGKRFLLTDHYRFVITSISNQSFSCPLSTVKALLKRGLLRKDV